MIVLEQSGVEELSWQDFSRTEELLERGYLDARVVLDRVEEQLAERAGVRTGARWWSRTTAGPRSREEGPGPSAYSDDAAARRRLDGLGCRAAAGASACTSSSVRNRCSR